MRRACTFVVAALALMGVAGCRHEKKVTIPTQAQAPVALEPVPEATLPPRVASVPPQSPPVATVELPKKKVRKHRKVAPEVAPASAPAPVQVASATPPPPIATVIGSLSAGGDASVASRQEAANLIDDNEKRLKALSKETIEGQRNSVTRVRNFDRDAMEALKRGDNDGALTLAKKAQVLLDDLEK